MVIDDWRLLTEPLGNVAAILELLQNILYVNVVGGVLLNLDESILVTIPKSPERIGPKTCPRASVIGRQFGNAGVHGN